MISIIISSYNPKYFDQFSANVKETIGVEYEIIQNWMGICEAYNKGAVRYGYISFFSTNIEALKLSGTAHSHYYI